MAYVYSKFLSMGSNIDMVVYDVVGWSEAVFTGDHISCRVYIESLG